MSFSDVVGQAKVRSSLVDVINEHRLSHAQLFLGPEGSGSLFIALAAAQYLMCSAREAYDSCGKCPSCNYFKTLSHPDLHFLFPQSLTETMEKKGIRGKFQKDFRSAIIQNPYMTLQEWYQEMEMENKQGLISVDDVAELSRKLSLKPFMGGVKVAIIWYPEMFNSTASNRMLKIFEEPPDRTHFFLVAENTDFILPTVLSRMQLIKVTRVDDDEMFAVVHPNLEEDYHKAKSIVHLADGNYSHALSLLQGNSASEEIKKIREWLLLCFEFPKKTSELLKWVDSMPELGREGHKLFLTNCLMVIRESFLFSIGNSALVRLEGEDLEFVTKFSRFVTAKNAEQITKALSDAIYHVERNANTKVLFLDLSIQIGSLLRGKS